MDRLFGAIFDTTGQICMNAKRIYVHRSRMNEVVNAITARLQKTKLGYGLDKDTTMGPLHSPQPEEVRRRAHRRGQGFGCQGAGVRRAARRRHEGRQLRASRHRGRSQALAARGHRRAVRPRHSDHALRHRRRSDQARRTTPGLALPVRCGAADPKAATASVASWSAGYVWVNDHGANRLDLRAPFGGMKASGIGREQGIEGIRAFQDTRSIFAPRCRGAGVDGALRSGEKRIAQAKAWRRRSMKNPASAGFFFGAVRGQLSAVSGPQNPAGAADYIEWCHRAASR